MLGPRRCGKTTLLASMVNEFMKISEEVSKKDSEYIKMVPRDATKGRINSSISAIKVSTSEGDFVTPQLSGTDVHTVYNFDIAYLDKSKEITDPDFKIYFHDFPGEWLRTDHDGLKKVPFGSSDILIMAVDASLIYEAVRTKHKAWAAMQLETENLLEVAKRWAAARKQDKEHPGLFILAPIKCETYYNDNLPIGLRVDNSEKLFNKITPLYNELIIAIKEISPETKLLYMPVDTIGCCFLNNKDWIESGPDGIEFVAQYKIPRGYTWTPFGPANVMLQILEYIIDNNNANKGWWDTILDFIGWNTDLGKKLRKMQDASNKNYQRSKKL